MIIIPEAKEPFISVIKSKMISQHHIYWPGLLLQRIAAQETMAICISNFISITAQDRLKLVLATYLALVSIEIARLQLYCFS